MSFLTSNFITSFNAAPVSKIEGTWFNVNEKLDFRYSLDNYSQNFKCIKSQSSFK